MDEHGQGEARASDVRVRRARAQDVRRVVGIVRAAYTPWVPRLGVEPAPLRTDYAAAVAAGAVQVLEDSRGALLGLLVLREEPGRLLLENVAVDPAARHRGLGRLLVAHAEHEAARAGLPEVYLYTHEQMSENIALYAALGYRETGRRVDDGLPRVFMSKRVEPESRG